MLVKLKIHADWKIISNQSVIDLSNSSIPLKRLKITNSKQGTYSEKKKAHIFIAWVAFPTNLIRQLCNTQGIL